MLGRRATGGGLPAERVLEDAIRHANEEADPAAQARQLLDAITAFLGQTDDAAAVRNVRPLLEPPLERAARVWPDEALRVLCTTAERCGELRDTTVTVVLRAWIGRPDETAFAQTWALASRTLPPGVHKSPAVAWYRLLDQALRGVARPAISPLFHRLATARLVEVVDARFDEHALSASPIWQVLYFLGPGTRAAWFCVLGDHAAQRGDEQAAAKRYQLAIDKGCAPARARLARFRAIEGHRHLVSGELASAEKKLDAAIALAGEPDYRALRVAATLARGKPPRHVLGEIVKHAGRTGSSAPLAMTMAWALIHAGREQEAAAALRDVVAHAPDESDLAANARLVLGVLLGDDDLLVEGARRLWHLHGTDWLSRSAVRAAPVLAAVARRDPTLFAATALGTNEASELAVTAARRALADAMGAALAGRVDEARRLLDLARRIVNEVGADAPAELTGVIDRASQHVVRLGEVPDELAYAALRRDDGIHPWAERAARIWAAAAVEPAGSRAHHLAIAHHARAYDLELAADDNAFDHWRTALEHWRSLEDDDAWWQRARTHLGEVLPDAAAAEVEQAVADVRENLMVHVLQPHQALAARLQQQDPARAREHMGVVRSVPPGRSARRRRQQPALYAIAELVDQNRFEQALDDLEPRLRIDPHDLAMVLLAMEIGRRWSEYNYRNDNRSWWSSRAGRILGGIRQLVDPACDNLGLSVARFDPEAARDDELASVVPELAKFEVWWGWHQWLKSETYLSGRKFEALVEALQKTIAHLRLAKRLLDDQRAEGIYGQVDEVLAWATDLQIKCQRLEDDPYWEPYRFGLR